LFSFSKPKNPWGDNTRRNTLDPDTKKNWFKKEEQIGYYVVGKVIGSGGVGTVRKARHIETKEWVCRVSCPLPPLVSSHFL